MTDSLAEKLLQVATVTAQPLHHFAIRVWKSAEGILWTNGKMKNLGSARQYLLTDTSSTLTLIKRMVVC